MIVFTALSAPGMAQLFAISREAVNRSNFDNHSFANSTLRSAFSLGFIIGPLIGTVLIQFQLSQHPKIMITIIILILMYTAHWMSSLNTAVFMTNHLGGSTDEVGLISSICAALEIPFMLTLGILGAKYSNRVIMLGGAILGAIYYLIVIFSGEMWQLIIGAQLLLAVFVAIISATGISVRDSRSDYRKYFAQPKSW